MRKLNIVAINGVAKSGKDTFVRFASQAMEDIKVVNFSTVDTVKEIYKLCGWNGEKTSEARKRLSDLKDFLSDAYDFSFLEIRQKIVQLSQNEAHQILFIHMREPKDLERLKREYPKAKTLLIRNPKIERNGEKGNHADREVFAYSDYDFTIVNDGTLEELKEKAKNFVELLISDKQCFHFQAEMTLRDDICVYAKNAEEAMQKFRNVSAYCTTDSIYFYVSNVYAEKSGCVHADALYEKAQKDREVLFAFQRIEKNPFCKLKGDVK